MSIAITNSAISRGWSDWQPSIIPTKTTLLTFTGDPSSLLSVISSAVDQVATETNWPVLMDLSRSIRGAQASITIMRAELVLATATDQSVLLQATEIIFNATLNLKALEFENNPYQYNLNVAANAIYLVVFGLIWGFNTLMVIKSKYWWYNITFFLGFGLEVIGFIGRIVSTVDIENHDAFLMQIIGLTMAPALVMAGMYFLCAQAVVIHGRGYSILKPLWYSYFFITTDVLSIFVQAGGGAATSIAYNNNKSTKPGTNMILGGICFQLLAMTFFVAFWFDFLLRLYFKDNAKIEDSNPYKKRSIKNFIKLLLATPSARRHTRNTLDKFYNPKFQSIRSRPLFNWFPLAITVSVCVVYIRCIYRVVELAEGWRGHLITHEVYLMTLESLMMSIAGLIFIPFHPYFVLGKVNVVKLASIRKRLDVDEGNGSENEENSSRSVLNQTVDVHEEK
ncbi:uncharacterized protein KQ657_002919 [Scheffersomyces spartinae]|uniref:Sphingoid long-chain base transporter RSB1 n=1 Tax=Scheffersomyces spartinae TaxID=45513 RepID=A0A9P8AGQ0_9ASCO|nr:uncharacterized protein KQ657_002919 [Scheffersomyces spartinae]KAG7191650.1 hypothetical protein KQ657_002919 [Scheffersomyces spartinae]